MEDEKLTEHPGQDEKWLPTRENVLELFHDLLKLHTAEMLAKADPTAGYLPKIPLSTYRIDWPHLETASPPMPEAPVLPPTKQEFQAKLIGMTIADARKAKWQAGVAEHGPIMNLDPLLELFTECIDGMNYCSVLRHQETWGRHLHLQLLTIENALRIAAVAVQEIHEQTPSRVYYPKPSIFQP